MGRVADDEAGKFPRLASFDQVGDEPAHFAGKAACPEYNNRPTSHYALRERCATLGIIDVDCTTKVLSVTIR